MDQNTNSRQQSGMATSSNRQLTEELDRLAVACSRLADPKAFLREWIPYFETSIDHPGESLVTKVTPELGVIVTGQVVQNHEIAGIGSRSGTH